MSCVTIIILNQITLSMKTGAVHHDELIYIFPNLKKAPLFTENDPEYTMVQRLTGFLINFAKNGYITSEMNIFSRKGIRWNNFILPVVQQESKLRFRSIFAKHQMDSDANWTFQLFGYRWISINGNQFEYGTLFCMERTLPNRCQSKTWIR